MDVMQVKHREGRGKEENTEGGGPAAPNSYCSLLESVEPNCNCMWVGQGINAPF